MPRSIKFNTTLEDARLINRIAERAENLAVGQNITFDRLSCEMDVTATHLNGTPLDLQKFLDFDDFNFAHDIAGILRHIDRSTGKLTGFFLPRCALKQGA